MTHTEPIESVLLGDAFDRLFFAGNPDRECFIREAYFDHFADPDMEVFGETHFVAVRRLPDGSIKRRMFYNCSLHDHLPPDNDAACRLIWNLPSEYNHYAPFYGQEVYDDNQDAAQKAAEAEAQWIQFGRQPQR